MASRLPTDMEVLSRTNRRHRSTACAIAEYPIQPDREPCSSAANQPGAVSGLYAGNPASSGAVRFNEPASVEALPDHSRSILSAALSAASIQFAALAQFFIPLLRRGHVLKTCLGAILAQRPLCQSGQGTSTPPIGDRRMICESPGHSIRRQRGKQYSDGQQTIRRPRSTDLPELK